MQTFNVAIRYPNGKRSTRRVNAPDLDLCIDQASQWGTVLEVAHIVATTITSSELVKL